MLMFTISKKKVTISRNKLQNIVKSSFYLKFSSSIFNVYYANAGCLLFFFNKIHGYFLNFFRFSHQIQIHT